jgi:uncharacterized protein YdhG (YjbR/CyaY superfamily)
VKASRKQFETVDEYIAAFPPDVRAVLEELRLTIRDAAPGAKEVISYGMPAFRLNGILVHFAAFKTHIGFYPTPSGIRNFRKELSRYDLAKGTVRFPMGGPIPLGLISRIVAHRVKENMEKPKSARH